jgi:hypothetical protein
MQAAAVYARLPRWLPPADATRPEHAPQFFQRSGKPTLLNGRVNDIERYRKSRLPSEAAAVADHPMYRAEPRTVQITLRVGF